MKQSLIAIAALASVSAWAQSSVTIDGNIEMGYVKPVGENARRLDAANGANQIRFRGVEDLGGGLKATFALAQRFSPETGGNDGSKNKRPSFQGESTVGLSGAFGTVKIGRQLTALKGPVGLTDPWVSKSQANLDILGANHASDTQQVDGEGAGRTDVIGYTSPNLAGWSAAVSLGPKNNTNVEGTAFRGDKALTSLWLSYSQGPLYVGAGTEQNRVGDRINAVLGTYDFGVAKVGAGYTLIDKVAEVQDRKTWVLSAAVPLQAFTLKAGYGEQKREGQDANIKKLGLGLEYALSKRTVLYTSYARDGAKAAEKSGYDVGLRHFF